MTAATLDEAALEEMEADEEYTPTSEAEAEQMKSLLLWMRKNQFTAQTVRLGGLTVLGLQDLRPKKSASTTGEPTEVYPDWVDQDLQDQLRQHKD